MNQFASLTTLRAELAREQEDLAAELIEKLDRFRIGAITTPQLANEAAAWLSQRMDALSAVMTDEERYPRSERDQDWLDGAAEVLDLATTLLIQVSRKRASLRAAA
jgi:hypothetical protein